MGHVSLCSSLESKFTFKISWRFLELLTFQYLNSFQLHIEIKYLRNVKKIIDVLKMTVTVGHILYLPLSLLYDLFSYVLLAYNESHEHYLFQIL